jgi:DNA-binding CsgD family transcriptional regulator
VAEPALIEPIAAADAASASSVAVLVVDDRCEVAEASLGACRMLGQGREAILSRPLAELLAPDAGERLGGLWDAFHTTGGHAGPFELAWPSAVGPVDINVTAAVLPGRHLIVLSPSQVGSAAAVGLDSYRARGAARGPTSRERQVLSMLATGDTDVEIARRLELSPATVQTHVRNAKAKLGARTRAQAVAMALRQGLIEDA